MLSKLRMSGTCGTVVGWLVSLLAAGQTPLARGAAPASAGLVDFGNQAQFAQIRSTGQAKLEPSTESYQGKPAAQLAFEPAPDGVRGFAAVVLEAPFLKIQDFTPYEALSVWVKNPGPDDAEVSLAVWDKNGNRSFPIPSTFTIRPGGWEQLVARLALQALDAKQIDSVHFFQKASRRPIRLLIADAQLLSPLAGRLAGRIQGTRQALNQARGNAAALGAQAQLEPRIAALAHRLDELEKSAAGVNTAAAATERLLQLAQISAEAQDLARAIQVQAGGKRVVLSGPLVESSWLNDQEKVKGIVDFVLLHTSLGDEVFPLLAPAKDLESLNPVSRKITGAGMDQVASEKLRRLALSGTSVTDDSLKVVEKFPRLQEILLDDTQVTSAALRHCESLKQLKILRLAGSQVADAGFEVIGKLANLEVLDLKRTRIHGPGLGHLESLTKLKELDLADTQLDDAGLSQFGKLTRLEALSLENTPITGAGFAQLKGLDKLSRLNLNRTRVGDSALRQLARLPRLVQLELSSTRISDGGLIDIVGPAPLAYLDLFGTNITDAGLAALENKQGLQHLFLSGTQTSDAGLAYLKKLNNLKDLSLDGTQVTDAGLQNLQGMKLISLKLGKTRITGEGLKYLSGLANLRFLDLSGTSITDESLASLASLGKLQTLLLSGTRVTSKGMRQLQGANSLAELHLEATDVGDEGLEMLSGLPNLQRLNLNETAVTNDGLKHLKRLGKLNTLGLRRTRITDSGLPELADRFVELDLGHTRITNQGVEQLQRCGRLTRLQLGATAITSDAVKLLQVLPGLTHLDLSETAVDDAGVQHVTLLAQMQELNLNGTAVSDRAIDAILQMSSLRRISLEGSRVSSEGASYLRRNTPKLAVDLVFPFVWGEPWTYYGVPEPVGAGRSRNPAVLEQLKDVPGLRYLQVEQAWLTPEFLRSLKDLPTLEHLSFQDTAITDDMLAELLGLSQVARLDFSHTRISDRGLAHLKDMQGLRELNLQGTRISGAGLEQLAALTRLQTLNLGSTLLDDQGVVHLAELRELRKLELGSSRVTDAGLEHLLELPRLQYLDLYGLPITDRGLARLGRLKGLRYCYLTNAHISDASMEQLRELTELEELGLDGTLLTDQGLARLAPLTGLRRLRISRTKVTAAGLKHLAALPNLERLELAGLPVTDAGLELLAALPRLKSLDLSDTRISNDALPALRGLPSLAELNVRDTGLSAQAVAQLQQQRPALRILTGTTPHETYSRWSEAIAVLYAAAVCAICFYGVHRYWLTWRLLRDPAVRQSPTAASQFGELPRVTVQLPMYNERHVAQRIIEAVCALDYPRERLQIQVLDDSTEDSADLTRRCCEQLAGAGHPVEYLHRSGRDGFKSGALAAGLATATGEFIAMFDADFLPDADFLQRTIHHFTDPAVGLVQCEWSHLNRSESWLTELQALFLDGHFVIEQSVRSHCGRWFNFNGTAGVWRRSCIDGAGGWQHDTLTEDTDLSYRAQMNGWKFVYLPTVHCQGELPASMTAFLGQQHRWTKGLIQTAKKLLPRILLGGAPLRVKLEAWYHLTMPVMYLVMFLMAAIALPAMFLVTPFTDEAALAGAVGLAALLLGTGGAATFYVASQRVQGYPLLRTICKLPLLMALGIGICAVNARAVVEALLGFWSPFVRTPKFGGRRDCGPDPAAGRRGLVFPAGLLELLMAGVLYACLVLSFLRPFTLVGAPFLLLFALGYSAVGMLRLLDQYAARANLLRSAAVPWRQLSFARLATGCVATLLLATAALTVFRLAAPPAASEKVREAVALGLDLATANWQPVRVAAAAPPGQPAVAAQGAIRQVHIERGSLVLGIQLDEQTHEGAIVLDLDGALLALGDSLAGGRQLAFAVEYSPRFTGEFQAFVKDRQGRSEYGSMQIVESHSAPRAVTVALVPDVRLPAMGYQDQGFDPAAGIRQLGFKISAQSDRVRGTGYRPFRGTIRIAAVRIKDIDPATHPAPELRPLDHERRPLPVLSAAEFLAGSGADRPWPLGYAFSGPVTSDHKQELEKTYTALAAQGCRFTRVYVGDYRTGLLLDRAGKVSGVEPEFLEYLDALAEIANRHGVTVMFSLTDNAMLNGGWPESLALVRDPEASAAFVRNVLGEMIKKLAGRQVIWDVFNEPENVTTLPLRDIQRYLDCVLAAGRRADPQARFTVVSRSRPEVAYWQGRGLDLYSHNIFTERLLEESLSAPRVLDAPIMVAEMAPELASAQNLESLREAGYAGVGIWGWGTRDKYHWAEGDLQRITRPLVHGRLAKD